MALYWVGPDGACSFTDTANWASTRNGAGGAGAPSNFVDLFILDGTSDITSGLVNGSLQPANITISFSGSVGTSSTPLTWSKTTGTVTINGGGGNISLKQNDGSGASLLALNDCSRDVTVDGQWTDIYAGGGGTLTIASGTVFVSGHVYGLGMAIVIGTGCTITDLDLHGRTATTNSVITNTTKIYSGTVTGLGVGGCSTVYVYDGATYNHRGTPTIAYIYVYPNATATAAGNSGPFTVTRSELWRRGSLFAQSGSLITYTNATQTRGFSS